jgi:hypothetical protein
MPSKLYEVEVSSVAIIGQRWRASLEAQRKSPRTIESYLAAVDALSNFLSRAGMPTIIANVRREHVEAFVTAQQRETTVRGKLRSVNSVGIEYRSLRVFFGYDLMQLAGWSSPEMVRRYGRSGRDDRARAAYAAHSPLERLLPGAADDAEPRRVPYLRLVAEADPGRLRAARAGTSGRS